MDCSPLWRLQLGSAYTVHLAKEANGEIIIAYDDGAGDLGKRCISSAIVGVERKAKTTVAFYVGDQMFITTALGRLYVDDLVTNDNWATLMEGIVFFGRRRCGGACRHSGKHQGMDDGTVGRKGRFGGG